MRTVVFKSVFDAILRRHGLDPLGDAVNHDTRHAIVEHINDRVNTALGIWPFLELSHTEERAYRTIWNATRQFSRSNPVTGKPDELFYLGAGYIPPTGTGGGNFGTGWGYYKVKSDAVSDPPAGTVPTNTTYFVAFSPVDTYVSFDQTCKRSIGQVLGVYKSNPRLNGCCPADLCLAFRPSEFGIDVCSPAGPTVFVHYMIPEPKFTMVPHIAGKSYTRGSRVFYPTDGNCYRALADNTNPPSDTSFWALEPFPKVLERYVKAGAYADCLRETFTNGDEQVRLARAAIADKEAQNAIESEIDRLIAQGQRYYYTQPRRYRYGVCVSQPWTGATVSELTDVCEDDGIFSPQPTPTTPGFYYFSDVLSLKTTTPTLVSKTTLSFAVGAMAVINPGGHFRLVAGPANDLDPGQGNPIDYNLATHNVHWEEVI